MFNKNILRTLSALALISPISIVGVNETVDVDRTTDITLLHQNLELIILGIMISFSARQFANACLEMNLENPIYRYRRFWIPLYIMFSGVIAKLHYPDISIETSMLISTFSSIIGFTYYIAENHVSDLFTTTYA